MTQKERMLSGMIYNPNDEEIIRGFVSGYVENLIHYRQASKREELMKKVSCLRVQIVISSCCFMQTGVDITSISEIYFMQILI